MAAPCCLAKFKGSVVSIPDKLPPAFACCVDCGIFTCVVYCLLAHMAVTTDQIFGKIISVYCVASDNRRKVLKG